MAIHLKGHNPAIVRRLEHLGGRTADGVRGLDAVEIARSLKVKIADVLAAQGALAEKLERSTALGERITDQTTSFRNAINSRTGKQDHGGRRLVHLESQLNPDTRRFSVAAFPSQEINSPVKPTAETYAASADIVSQNLRQVQWGPDGDRLDDQSAAACIEEFTQALRITATLAESATTDELFEDQIAPQTLARLRDYAAKTHEHLEPFMRAITCLEGEPLVRAYTNVVKAHQRLSRALEECPTIGIADPAPNLVGLRNVVLDEIRGQSFTKYRESIIERPAVLDFDPDPIGGGSEGWVFKAGNQQGEAVAVKVAHGGGGDDPYKPESLNQDLEMINACARYGGPDYKGPVRVPLDDGTWLPGIAIEFLDGSMSLGRLEFSPEDPLHVGSKQWQAVAKLFGALERDQVALGDPNASNIMLLPDGACPIDSPIIEDPRPDFDSVRDVPEVHKQRISILNALTKAERQQAGDSPQSFFGSCPSVDAHLSLIDRDTRSFRSFRVQGDPDKEVKLVFPAFGINMSGGVSFLESQARSLVPYGGPEVIGFHTVPNRRDEYSAFANTDVEWGFDALPALVCAHIEGRSLDDLFASGDALSNKHLAALEGLVSRLRKDGMRLDGLHAIRIIATPDGRIVPVDMHAVAGELGKEADELLKKARRANRKGK
ncbi:hypothetical protein ACFL6C_04185 [Myxococcota bacterium]